MVYNKVIFLDIDGPLATDECFKNKFLKFGKNIYWWNKNCVEILNQVINETDAEIILSSDWRLFFSLDELDEIFKLNGVIKSPAAVTDNAPHKLSSSKAQDRIHQIERFLKENSINNWVSVDDLDLKSNIINRFVLIDPLSGLNEEGIKNKIITLLNN